jgi:hypothetical protein
MLRRVAVVRTNVSAERIVSTIRLTIIGELVIANVSRLQILVTLMMEAIRTSEMSVLTRAIQHHIPEDDILHFSA